MINRYLKNAMRKKLSKTDLFRIAEQMDIERILPTKGSRSKVANVLSSYISKHHLIEETVTSIGIIRPDIDTEKFL